MNLFSKNEPEVKEINGRVYKLQKWNTATTILTGKRVGFALAPAMAAYFDSKNAENNFDVFSEEDGYSDSKLTAAAYQLAEHVTDELFMDTMNKLMSSIKKCDEVDIHDWDLHMQTYGEDFDQLFVWSIKENLLNFLLQMSTFRSKVEMIQTEVNYQINKLKSEKNVDGNTK